MNKITLKICLFWATRLCLALWLISGILKYMDFEWMVTTALYLLLLKVYEVTK